MCHNTCVEAREAPWLHSSLCSLFETGSLVHATSSWRLPCLHLSLLHRSTGLIDAHDHIQVYMGSGNSIRRFSCFRGTPFYSRSHFVSPAFISKDALKFPSSQSLGLSSLFHFPLKRTCCSLLMKPLDTAVVPPCFPIGCAIFLVP